MIPVCPRCGSKDVLTEKSLDGIHFCVRCKHEWPQVAPRKEVN